MVLVLPDDDVAALLDLTDLLPVIEEAFVKQGRGEVERPERPHFHVGAGLEGDEPLGMGLVMPAYVHGATYYATKLVGVHEGNPGRGLPTVNAQIALTEARTGLPASFMAGTRITNARTGCIGGLGARELAVPPVRLGILGAGAQARWQARAIDAAIGVESIRVYSPSDSRVECAADLEAVLDVPAEPADTPREAVAHASVVVTATTSSDPVFPADALRDGTLVIAIGAYNAEMQELEPAVFERAARAFADVPEEVAGIGDLRPTGLGPSELVSLSSVLEGNAGREGDDEILVLDSVGTAVLDAAAAEHLYERAETAGRGTRVELEGAGEYLS